jgi:adenylate cyclase
VEVHANLISGALDHTIKYRPPEALAIAVLTVLLVGVPLALLAPFLSALTATLVFAALFLAVLGANLWAWQAQNFVLPLAGPLLMLAALYVVNMVYGYFTETRSRRLITGLFGTYVQGDRRRDGDASGRVLDAWRKPRDDRALSDIRIHVDLRVAHAGRLKT